MRRQAGLTQNRDSARNHHFSSADRAEWSHMWLDLRYALRTLRAAPGFAAAAILTLAIGIGANTVMFSIVDTLLVRPFPYLHPERLVFIWTRTQRGPDRVMNSLPDFLDWRSRNPGFDDMGAW